MVWYLFRKYQRPTTAHQVCSHYTLKLPTPQHYVYSAFIVYCSNSVTIFATSGPATIKYLNATGSVINPIAPQMLWLSQLVNSHHSKLIACFVNSKLSCTEFFQNFQKVASCHESVLAGLLNLFGECIQGWSAARIGT